MYLCMYLLIRDVVKLIMMPQVNAGYQPAPGDSTTSKWQTVTITHFVDKVASEKIVKQ